MKANESKINQQINEFPDKGTKSTQNEGNIVKDQIYVAL